CSWTRRRFRRRAMSSSARVRGSWKRSSTKSFSWAYILLGSTSSKAASSMRSRPSAPSFRSRIAFLPKARPTASDIWRLYNGCRCNKLGYERGEQSSHEHVEQLDDGLSADTRLQLLPEAAHRADAVSGSDQADGLH